MERTTTWSEKPQEDLGEFEKEMKNNKENHDHDQKGHDVESPFHETEGNLDKTDH